MMHRYIKGAVFERKIIHDLIDMGALIAMRGAGSKSAGSIKADIMALFPSGYLVIIQAKTSKRKLKKEKEEFIAHKGIQDRRIIWLWATPEHYKQDLKAIEEVVK
jgi:Holliday junction resolvase